MSRRPLTDFLENCRVAEVRKRSTDQGDVVDIFVESMTNGDTLACVISTVPGVLKNYELGEDYNVEPKQDAS